MEQLKLTMWEQLLDLDWGGAFIAIIGMRSASNRKKIQRFWSTVPWICDGITRSHDQRVEISEGWSASAAFEAVSWENLSVMKLRAGVASWASGEREWTAHHCKLLPHAAGIHPQRPALSKGPQSERGKPTVRSSH
jgi:hypothetical protein